MGPILSVTSPKRERPAADETGEELGPPRIDREIAGVFLGDVPADFARVGDEPAGCQAAASFGDRRRLVRIAAGPIGQIERRGVDQRVLQVAAAVRRP